MNNQAGPLWELEEAAWERGYASVCGCDEAVSYTHLTLPTICSV